MESDTSRRTFLIGTGLAASSGGLLAACSANPDRSETPPPAGNVQEASGEIDVWSSVEGAQRSSYETYYVNAFEKAYPEITVNVSYRPLGQLEQQTQTALAAGRGPDLVTASGPADIGGYATADLLLPLDEYAADNDWSEKLLPWALESGKVDGTLYALPQDFETLVIFYNKTLFERHGYPTPQDRVSLEDLCAELQAAGITPFAAGNAEFQAVSEWWVTLMFNHFAGADLTYEALTGERSWEDPAFVDSMGLIKDYFRKGWVAGGVRRYFTTQFATMYEDLANGNAGMMMSGSWEFPQLNEHFASSGQDYGWFPIPRLSGMAVYPSFDIGIGETSSISKQSDNPDGVAAYLNWQLEDREAMMKFVQDTDASPMPVPLSEDDFPESMNPRLASHFLALVDATNQGNFGYTTWTFWPSGAHNFCVKKFDSVISDEMTPEEFSAGHEAAFSRDRDRGLVPNIIPRTA